MSKLVGIASNSFHAFMRDDGSQELSPKRLDLSNLVVS